MACLLVIVISFKKTNMTIFSKLPTLFDKLGTFFHIISCYLEKKREMLSIPGSQPLLTVCHVFFMRIFFFPIIQPNF